MWEKTEWWGIFCNYAQFWYCWCLKFKEICYQSIEGIQLLKISGHLLYTKAYSNLLLRQILVDYFDGSFENDKIKNYVGISCK